MFKKIIVIGSPGSGKSTFSRKLRDATGLPLHYLDMVWHKPDRTTVTREEFTEKLAALLAGEEWIIDGNYKRTLEMRLEACDTVFLLDLPTEVCLSSVESRIKTKREDMPWIEEEFDPEFREYIESFSKEVLPRIYRALENYKDKRNIIVFRSRKETEEFISSIERLSEISDKNSQIRMEIVEKL